MTDPRYIGTILYVGLAIFAALLAAGLLMQERRWSVQRTALLWGAEGLILLLDLYLCFGLLPAPLRLPVSLTVGFLSYSAVFIAYFFQLFIRNKSNRQLQIRTMIIFMINRLFFCYINNFRIFGFFVLSIPCPSMDSECFFHLCRWISE